MHTCLNKCNNSIKVTEEMNELSIIKEESIKKEEQYKYNLKLLGLKAEYDEKIKKIDIENEANKVKIIIKSKDEIIDILKQNNTNTTNVMARIIKNCMKSIISE